MGSSDIEARNKQLLALEEAVDKVFQKHLNKLQMLNAMVIIQI